MITGIGLDGRASAHLLYGGDAAVVVDQHGARGGHRRDTKPCESGSRSRSAPVASVKDGARKMSAASRVAG
jgi:hypothetical protein